MARKRKLREDADWNFNTPDKDEWWQETQPIAKGVSFANDIVPPPEDGGYIRLTRHTPRKSTNTSFAQMCVQDPAAGLEI